MTDRSLLGQQGVDAAFADHMKVLFAAFVRHLPEIEGARKEFRKGYAIARQAHAEMSQIVEEAGV